MEISLSEWLAEYDSYNTVRQYTSSVKQFLESVYPGLAEEVESEKTQLGVRYLPPELKEEILDRYSLRYVREERSDKDVRRDLLEYKEGLVKTVKGETVPLAPQTRTVRISAVKLYLQANGIDPQRTFRNLWNHLTNGNEKGNIAPERIPSNAELKRICEYLPVQGKALALLLASSGMRIGEAVQLLDDDLDWNSDPVTIRIRGVTTKNGRRRITFITPEAAEAVEEWMKFRPQYLEQASGRSARHARDGDYEGMLFPFNTGTFNIMWNNSLDKAGLMDVDDRTKRVKMRPHNLRKFFRLRVGKQGRDEAEALMGHQQGLHRVYARFIGKEGEERLKKVYMDAIPELSIYERGVASEKVKELEEKSEQLETRVMRSDDVIDALLKNGKAKDVEITELKKKIKELESKQKGFRTELDEIRERILEELKPYGYVKKYNDVHSSK